MQAPLIAILLAGCVLDRTGQSATEAYKREMALHATRITAIEASLKESETRVRQLEEVTRARGQEEIMRMETVDQVRNELARIRGELEVFQHNRGVETEFQGKFQEDVDFRMSYLEARAAALEKALGVQAPAPPEKRAASVIAAAGGTSDSSTTTVSGNPTPGTDTNAASEPVATTPDEVFTLAQTHLAESRNKAARAVFERFIAQFPKDERVPEARYRAAQTLYNEGDYQKAILGFQEVLDKHGTSPWASWAMLRQGQCFESLGQKQNALVFYDDVIRLYPKSKAAKEAKTLKGGK